MNKIKLLLIAILLVILPTIIIASNVANYNEQPISGNDNVLVITGTQNVSGTLNVTGTLNTSSGTVSMGLITASSATVTNTLTVDDIQAQSATIVSLTYTYDTISATNAVVLYGVNAATGVFSGAVDIGGLATASSATITNTCTVGTLTDGTMSINSGALTAVTTIDTGQGANELYDMDQNVMTTSTVTFANATLENLTLDSFVVMSDSGTVTISSSTVIIASKAGAMEITLPDAATSTGKIFTIKKTNADASIVSLQATGGTIDGTDPYNEIDAQYDFVTIISDGTNWHIITKYITP